MLPFLHLHTLAATRGDGLPPELLNLLERLAEAPAVISEAMTDRHPMDATRFTAVDLPRQTPLD
jgi:hypothetical protein